MMFQEEPAASISLPEPTRVGRWQPLRSGVLNLYRYDYEEFHFEDGRLLLRGNNGSGKSRVLALQLPFLLDGEVSPGRVEPDGDIAKRIEWNLLMGRHSDRTGYTWIEFGRRDADGTVHFITLGCGLRAVAGQSGLHSRWLFITPQRIGRDLFLQTAQHMPLGRERLIAALGASGRVFPKVDDYRRAVDEALFGLGPRYAPLIELLLRLRRPQLSRKLDEEELSGALSDALPTLPTAIIDEVAESFRSLEADRETLREFTQARDAVASFLREYAVYVRIAVRRRATAVRSTHAAYEAAQRAARDAETRLRAASDELAKLVGERSALDQQLAGAESVERTLRESPEMRTADEVRLAGDAAASAAQALTIAEGDEQRAAEAARQAREREERAGLQCAEIERELGEKLRVAEAAAHAADLAEMHREQLPGPESTIWTKAEKTLRRAIDQRSASVPVLREREQAVAASERELKAAELARRTAEENASAAREAEHVARKQLVQCGNELLSAYYAWRSATKIIQALPAEELTGSFIAWTERREGRSPLRVAVDDAHGGVVASLANREATLTQTAVTIERDIAELNTAMERLERGETQVPPPPLARKSERAGRPGAPLWRVCDFRAEVTTESRSGVEAALQASGLLDAWILPDGRLLAGAEDTFLLTAADSTESPATTHLGAVLAVAIDETDLNARQLSPTTVERVLARVGFGVGMGAHWIAADGRWQLGPVSGQWTKATADYIGESTRAAARRRQLSELRARHEQAIAERQRVGDQLAAVARDRATAAVEFSQAPADEPVLRAGYDLASATRAMSDTLVASERAARIVNEHRSAREEAVALRDRDAADLKLSAWLGRLDTLMELTHAYATALAGLWPTARHRETATGQLTSFREQMESADVELRSRKSRQEQAASDAETARQRFSTLRETHGQEISVVLAKLELAEQEVKRRKGEILANEKQQLAQTVAKTKAEEDGLHAEEQRSAREEQRRAAIARLQHFAGQRLLAEADPALRDIDEAGWSVAHAVEIARRIEPLLADAPEAEVEWARRQDAIHSHIQELRDRLITHGHQPETHQSDELVLVRCVFQARPHTMTELHTAFSGELEERDRLLQAKEREIIENHLLAEAAVELQKLIRAAENWRASANDELNDRPTSSGVRFRFQWEPDTEIRFHEVRPVLLRRGELWTPSERTALAAFLQGRIAAEQEDDQSGSWRDHLARALDYRRWHRFVVERQQDGKWRRLDKTTYGTGSGGEKALALTLPRFAAAAAHYRSAATTAPRLVMLDEAFAGIDPTMRAQCMGVLTQFDLDVLMTSEQEWGCYPTVPALAIYHLTTLPGLDAVAASRWLWNGREKRQSDPMLPPVAAPETGPESAPLAENEPVH
jgi:uncharacterized protein (TIGR02680 family)